MPELSQQEQKVNDLQEQVESLQIKIAYQEDTIESLNNTVIKQQDMLDKHARLLEKMLEKLSSMKNDDIPTNEVDERPPHY